MSNFKKVKGRAKKLALGDGGLYKWVTSTYNCTIARKGAQAILRPLIEFGLIAHEFGRKLGTSFSDVLYIIIGEGVGRSNSIDSKIARQGLLKADHARRAHPVEGTLRSS